MSALRAFPAGSADHFVPGGPALADRNRNRSSQLEEVGRLCHKGAPTFDREHHLVALMQVECVPYSLGDRDLTLRRHACSLVHRMSLLTQLLK